ncbi:hypothetical protein [Spirosoma agri]|uniref:Glycosyltransferase RgtA/B/C/D-like domain-containing protein n=1 Tax=Spirosoma agri TaxID=1987381 RepID=A0A6M0INQ7_9BACT|nr:hypothetical protein [Spirosoma agri]NEU69868.1 hypothetical protein [Spirosoma agri]
MPNNQDGLSYHLVRIQHWIQNKNVSYYPTNFTVQNYYNVLSEYTILHSQLLSGSDYFMNSIQCLAMLSSLLAASLIAQELGATTRGQWLTAVLVLTLPMGILQSTTTQNDYLTGYFTLSAIYLGIRLIRRGPHQKAYIGYLALAIALGGFTKYSFFLIAFPFVAWFGIEYIYRYGWWAGVNLAVVCLLVLLAIYGPFWYRNYQVLGSILSPSSDSPLFLDSYSNERLTGQSLLSSLSKNLVMHLALPSQNYNDALLSGMYSFHRYLGINISDPATTMGDYKLTFTINEDTSTNCLHLLLAIVSGIIVCVRPTDRVIRTYGLCLVGGLLMYSAGFKWQYFHSRTQLPLFLLAAPFTAQVVASQLTNHSRWISFLSVVLLVTALPYIYSNNGKNIIPVRSLVKQIVGYSPASVSSASFPSYLSRERLTQKLAEIGYKPNPVDPDWYDCKLNEHPAYALLEEIGYLPPSEPSIWTVKKRQDFFFVLTESKKSEWDQIVAILKKGNHTSIGIMIEGPDLVYPLWTLTKNALNQPVTINYVYFPAVLNQLDYNRLTDSYSCIISNLGYTQNLLSTGSVKKKHQVGTYQVIELTEPSRLVYDSRPKMKSLKKVPVLAQNNL